VKAPKPDRTFTDANWGEALTEICPKQFGVKPPVFLEALLMSPNARGYILGSLSELLLRDELHRLSYKTLRIKEKWVGPKLHHGDYYVSSDGKCWFVVESKGLKSNSERWHKIAQIIAEAKALEAWFKRKRGGEIKEWWDRLPATRKQKILVAGSFNKARILETHFVSGTAGRAGRKIATPRKSEFHIVALDLYLRTGRHEFIYAPSGELPSPAGHPDHLKQNYLIDIVVPGVDTEPTLPRPWTRDFASVFKKLKNPVSPNEMQVDQRKPGEREGQLESNEVDAD
jgi:hypothetical protein